jgi:hypothetical protein
VNESVMVSAKSAAEHSPPTTMQIAMIMRRL